MFPDLTRDDVFRLETRRQWLRWARQADAGAIIRLAGEKAVAEMTSTIPHPYPPERGERFVLESRRLNMDGAALAMAITPRTRPSEFMGVVSISANRDGMPELGYWLGTPYWDKGFATEAARSLIDAFFAYTGGTELTAWTRVINPASRRVLEKCGFTTVGSGLQAFPARGGVLPVDHFRLDRRKWESLKAWSASDYVPHPREPILEACAAH
jgi:RimJ/RimL family protein N-acetyltransferase